MNNALQITHLQNTKYLSFAVSFIFQLIDEIGALPEQIWFVSAALRSNPNQKWITHPGHFQQNPESLVLCLRDTHQNQCSAVENV